MKKYLLHILTIFIVFYSLNAKAQKYYWIGFTDKNNTNFSLSTPVNYLSDRAIQRRVKQNIAIDSLDLPVNSDYILEVIKIGAKHLHSSKWLNGITVKAETDSFDISVLKLPFVKEVQLTKTSVTKSGFQKFNETSDVDSFPINTSLYGASVYQTSTLNGQFLHNQNYKGQGIHIAVLDGGFYKANEYFALDSLWDNGQILGTKDFVDPTVDIFSTHWHGMSVLSCMGGNVPGQLIGTAPKASYWLIRSEDTGSEFLIEEDNWVAAAEFADSAGVDIINSSLGYTQFNDPQTNHVYADMDGKTTRITRGANIAASRGILVFSSAGNEGNNSWKYIVAPSDGENVIGVGAVNKDSVAASFTSYGPAFDGKIKPNVSAVGWNTYLQKSDGKLGYLNGTSFSSPVMAGMAACLWGSVKHVSAKELKQVIEQHSHLFANPNSLLGYGIPNFALAWGHFFPMKVENYHDIVHWEIYPNPVKDNLFLYKKNGQSIGEVAIEIFSVEGRLLKKWIKANAQRIELHDIQSLPNGILLLKISSDNNSETIKLSKAQ
jgi:serine protease AprX